MASVVEGAAISRGRAWLLASRPKTLPAAVAPVLVGTALAWSDGGFAALPAAVALLCSLLIQIGTNFANDYFDFLKGADTEERIGPVRVVQSGLIAPRTVRNAMAGVFGLAFLAGLYLVVRGGWPILAVGIASLVSAVMYTAGPFSLAYHGLGDLFAFVFFGPVAVVGTYFVQARTWSARALLASIPVGAMVAAILVVNNYRDIATDAKAGKRTLAVRIGRRWTLVEYCALLALSLLIPLGQAVATGAYGLLLPLGGAPLAAKLMHTLAVSSDGPTLNRALASTGRLLAIFGVLYAIGLSI